MKKVFIPTSFIVIFVLIFSLYCYLNQNYETPILMYHSLDAERVNNYAAVAPENFLKQMKYISNHNHQVISLQRYCQLRSQGEPIPKKSVVLTFDDGHKDNLVAFKILEQLGYPATFFIIPSKLNKSGYLSRADITRALKNPKIKIGSHTLNEAYLPSLEGPELKKEIFGSKQRLKELFNQEIRTISYTIGGFNQEILKEVEAAGYLCACTTNRGFSKELSAFTLRRIKVTNRDSGIRLWAKLSGFYNAFRKPKHPY